MMIAVFPANDPDLPAIDPILDRCATRYLMWEPFANWLAAEHPDDLAKMYEDPEGQTGSLRTERATAGPLSVTKPCLVEVRAPPMRL